MVRFSSDGTIEKYVYGNGLIASYEVKPTDETTTTEYKTYIYDIRGSVTEVANVIGSVTAEYRYSTYGDRSIISGTEFDELGYCARDGVLTEASGLLYMRARYYYPMLMRFINEDIVIGDISDSASLNRYAYVNGNPITLIDPFGLCAEKYNASDIYVWSSGNFQSYLSVLGFYGGKNDYNLFSDDTQKALRNFATVYGLNEDEKLGNILGKVIEAYASYNLVVKSNSLKNLADKEVNGEKVFKYDDIQRSNFGKVWAFLEVGCNYNLTQISGVMGCINLESRMSSDNANDPKYTPGQHIPHDIDYEKDYAYKDEIAYGLIQWYSEDRKEDLATTAAGMGLRVSDINAQLMQLRSDIGDRDKAWLSADNPEKAAFLFNETVIVGESKKTKQRMARSIYDEFNKR